MVKTYVEQSDQTKIFYMKIKTFLVVEKPAGIPVETSRIGSKDMVSLLKNHLAETGGKPGGIPYLGMIHRLDQPVQASWYSPKIRRPPLP